MRRDFRITKEPLVVIIPMIDIMLFLLVFFMISTLRERWRRARTSCRSR